LGQRRGDYGDIDRRNPRISAWEEWFNLLLGLWSMVSPWALGFMHTKAMHVSIGLGAMVTFVAALGS
jgi:SPW repeat